MEWRRVWIVTTLRVDRDARRDQVATAPAELRVLLTEARADPLVWHVRFESQHQLVGDPPTECRHGHTYRVGSEALAAISDWLPCECSGHYFWRCVRDGCGDERWEPPLAHDCQPAHTRKVVRHRPG